MNNNKSEKKIVLLNQVTGYLFIDIANEFTSHYSQVVLVAGSINPFGCQINDSIKIVKVCSYNRKNIRTRTVSWLSGFIKMLFLIKTRYRNYDLFISSNPPLAILLPLFTSRHTNLLIYDIYPDGLTATKLLKPNHLIVKFWTYLNRKAFRKVNNIFTLTDGMAKLLSRYSDENKIVTIPAWSSDFIYKERSSLSSNLFRSKFGLEDKILIIYSGNLGKQYHLESIFELASLLEDFQQIKFIIAGGGWKKKKLEDTFINNSHSNCILLPSQPADLFKQMIYAMHLGIVSLDDAVADIAIPSKTYNILAGGKPILCIGSKNSNLGKMIRRYDVGTTFEPTETSAMAKYIKTLVTPGSKAYNILCENAISTANKFTSINASKICSLAVSNE